MKGRSSTAKQVAALWDWSHERDFLVKQNAGQRSDTRLGHIFPSSKFYHIPAPQDVEMKYALGGRVDTGCSRLLGWKRIFLVRRLAQPRSANAKVQ